MKHFPAYTARVSWWNDKSEHVAIAEPPIDRVEQTQSRVQKIKAELSTLDREILDFKTKHRARVSRFGVLLSVHSPSVTGYAAIRTEWDGLLRRRDSLMAQWHSALRDFSEAKQEAAK